MTDSGKRKRPVNDSSTALPFIQRSPESVVAGGQSAGTLRVTESHVRFFRLYLEEIRGKTPEESSKLHLK